MTTRLIDRLFAVLNFRATLNRLLGGQTGQRHGELLSKQLML
jgi:hypothetical protein